MSNAHFSTRRGGTALYDEAQVRREVRRVERDQAIQRKLERTVKRINARGGR